MATLIPALSSCLSRMTSGEKRLAERLEKKLDDDYLMWYDVPIGPKQSYPDFIILHPRRGLLILETKDWKLETIENATGIHTTLVRFPGGSSNTVSKNYCSGIMTKLTQDLTDMGFQYFDWNVDSGDAGTSKTSEDVYNSVISGLIEGQDNISGYRGD